MATNIHHEPNAVQLDLSGFRGFSSNLFRASAAAARREQKYFTITRGCPLKRLEEASNNPQETLYLAGYRTQFPTYNGGDRDDVTIEVRRVRMLTPLKVHSTVSFHADVSIGGESIAATINYDTVAETGFFRVG